VEPQLYQTQLLINLPTLPVKSASRHFQGCRCPGLETSAPNFLPFALSREVGHPPANQIPFSIFTIGSVSPFACGRSTRSHSTYPCLRYNGTPGSVAPISHRVKPSTRAAASHISSSRLPIPRRAESGCTKKARILAASVPGSSSASSRPGR
jgi:hypothetical protein